MDLWEPLAAAWSLFTQKQLRGDPAQVPGEKIRLDGQVPAPQSICSSSSLLRNKPEAYILNKFEHVDADYLFLVACHKVRSKLLAGPACQDQSQGLAFSIPGGLSAAPPGLLHTRSLTRSGCGLCGDVLQSSFPTGGGWQLSGNITTCNECPLALTGVRMK